MDDKVYASTCKRLQYLLVVMGDYKFSGADHRVISFLARCKANVYNDNMAEAMALMAFPICYHLLLKRRMSPKRVYVANPKGPRAGPRPKTGCCIRTLLTSKSSTLSPC